MEITVKDYLDSVRADAAVHQDWQTVAYVTQVLGDGEPATSRWRAFAKVMMEKWSCPVFAPLGDYMRNSGLNMRSLLRYVITMVMP